MHKEYFHLILLNNDFHIMLKLFRNFWVIIIKMSEPNF